MPIAQSLIDFQSNLAQCDSLIATAHAAEAEAYRFAQRDREQITVAAFLNMFIAWEEFIEAAINYYMMGDETMGGNTPLRYVSPPTRSHSAKMVIHTNRYFDFANHENVKKIANLFFNAGYPFETPINSMSQELADLKTMRNACAHMSSTTKIGLESLAIKIFGSPKPGISVYQMLTSSDPRTNPDVSVYAAYRDKLSTAAAIIAQG